MKKIKILGITKEQAQQIAGENYFVGNLSECWAKATENGYIGSIPVSRLDGNQFVDNDEPTWLNVSDILVNKQNEFFYKLLNIIPEWECKKQISSKRTPKGWIDCISKIWVDKKTGIISYTDPTL